MKFIFFLVIDILEVSNIFCEQNPIVPVYKPRENHEKYVNSTNIYSRGDSDEFIKYILYSHKSDLTSSEWIDNRKKGQYRWRSSSNLTSKD
ncbi:unnamed protein product [Caenorhabditis angaria]|uniref:Uncharacterized protein n=1 Tax=Caenorhabditis angaria TaxID=860376 RepID=A0A9P1J641_9PELO|nr:unnamed protein product [Caenorhabditis angaria]